MKIIKNTIILATAALMMGAVSSCIDYANLDNMYQPASGMYARFRKSALHWVIWEITTIRD